MVSNLVTPTPSPEFRCDSCSAFVHDYRNPSTSFAFIRLPSLFAYVLVSFYIIHMYYMCNAGHNSDPLSLLLLSLLLRMLIVFFWFWCTYLACAYPMRRVTQVAQISNVECVSRETCGVLCFPKRWNERSMRKHYIWGPVRDVATRTMSWSERPMEALWTQIDGLRWEVQRLEVENRWLREQNPVTSAQLHSQMELVGARTNISKMTDCIKELEQQLADQTEATA